MHPSTLKDYARGVLHGLGLRYEDSAHQSIHTQEAEIDVQPTGPFYASDAHRVIKKAAEALKAKHGTKGSYSVTHVKEAPDVYGHWELAILWLGRRGE